MYLKIVTGSRISYTFITGHFLTDFKVLVLKNISLYLGQKL